MFDFIRSTSFFVYFTLFLVISSAFFVMIVTYYSEKEDLDSEKFNNKKHKKVKN